jgi:hypothetical protein
MKTSPSLARVHRILGCLAVFHSASLFAVSIGVNTGDFYGVTAWPWWLHHLWVGVASLWVLWPLVLVIHPGRSAARIAVPIAVGLVFLLPCIRDYRVMAPVTFGLQIIKYQVSYYDRNGDGIVDFELHHALNAYDADWALSDTHFTGRYDFKIQYSPFGRKEHVDLPVPKHVKITPGQPQLWRVR